MNFISIEVQNRVQNVIEAVTLREVDIHKENPYDLIGKRFVSNVRNVILNAPCRFSEKEYPIIYTIKKITDGGTYKHYYLHKESGGSIAWDSCLIEID